MADRLCISLDAMGGDSGPATVVAGAAIALERYPYLSFCIFGDQQQIDQHLARYPKLQAVSKVTHTDVAVKMDDKPSQALRSGRRVSSMWMSIEAVRSGEADCAISGGNTGALMAMARFCLKTMAGIDRPAIAAIWPTLRGDSIVLDVGATIGADARQLVEFAVMGEAMSRALFSISRPTVGLLNIGVEEVKGLEEVREAHRRLRDMDLPVDYKGFVEGDDVGRGTVDVVVCEGFSGNIALKTAEGTAKQISEYLRAAMNRTLRARIGYLLARRAFMRLREKMDPSKANGGVFLGLNGLVLKSHGSASAEGFASAICLGHDMLRNDILAKIRADLSDHTSAPTTITDNNIRMNAS